jgi:hemerythrin
LQVARDAGSAGGAVSSAFVFDIIVLTGTIQLMLEWTSDYETGVPELDAQHKVLFDNINRLEKLLEKPEIVPAEAASLLEFLEQYAAQHFVGEETCMARFHCPAHARNKKEHEMFLHILKIARGEFESAAKPRSVLERLHENMAWWINDHILKIDVKLKPCVGT